jgi:thiosulfate/3-mercaptopyruvate sulfurtransferase
MAHRSSLIDVDTLARALDDPALRLFDATVVLERPPEGGPYAVRSGRREYDEGHIPGAAFADIAGEFSDPGSPFAFTLPSAARFAQAAGAAGIGPGADVVVYAQESPMWATRLWWMLRHFGFDDVSVLDGGLAAWKGSGRELSETPGHYPPTTFSADPRPAQLASRGDVESIVRGERQACLVNALTAPVFRGEGPSSYSRPGRIPGSVNTPWNALIDPQTNRFRSPAELEAVFDASGVSAGANVIAYCGGGISATVDLFALALIGREARLYDGSLTEWSADPELPLELG